MIRLRHVDTVTDSELRNMQDVLVSKETEVVQSKSTARGLATGQQHKHRVFQACFFFYSNLTLDKMLSMKRQSDYNKTWRRYSSWRERLRVSWAA